jgi:hypothetical protein
LKPLLKLLRSGVPVPRGIADMFAEMLDPEGEGYLFFRLVLINTEGKIRNTKRELKDLEITADYRSRIASGTCAEAAAAKTGEKFGCSGRQVHRRVKDWERREQWLKAAANNATNPD